MPVVLALVDLRQMLPDARHLLLERNDARLDAIEREVRHGQRHFVRQSAELLADVGEQLARYHQTDVLVDDCVSNSDVSFALICSAMGGSTTYWPR